MATTLPRPAVLPHSSGCQSCSASDCLSLEIICPSSAPPNTSGSNTTAGSFASTTPTNNNPPTPSGAKSRPSPPPQKQQQRQHADCNMSQSVVLAHSRELEPHRSVSTSMQNINWCPMQESPHVQSEDHVTRSSPELLVAVWPTTTTTISTSTDGRSRQPSQRVSVNDSIGTPFIHIPRCKLSITNFDDIHQPLPAAGRGGPYPGYGSTKIEQVALPRAVVQQFLSGIRLRNGLAGMDVDVAFPRHFDDDHEWVQSRCILSDFSELEEEEAARLSSEEKLCCWGSIVLTKDGEHGWDLGFVVHRVLTQRDPVTGTCACGRR